MQSVRDNPADVEGTLELADLFEQDGSIDEAEKLLAASRARFILMILDSGTCHFISFHRSTLPLLLPCSMCLTLL